MRAKRLPKLDVGPSSSINEGKGLETKVAASTVASMSILLHK